MGSYHVIWLIWVIFRWEELRAGHCNAYHWGGDQTDHPLGFSPFRLTASHQWPRVQLLPSSTAHCSTTSIASHFSDCGATSKPFLFNPRFLFVQPAHFHSTFVFPRSPLSRRLFSISHVLSWPRFNSLHCKSSLILRFSCVTLASSFRADDCFGWNMQCIEEVKKCRVTQEQSVADWL